MAEENAGKTTFPIIGVGASAGGLEALRSMFSGYSEELRMAFVVVQHLDPTHESLMAQLIERYTPMEVKQAEGGEKIEPNHIYVIPPGHGLAVEDGVLKLTEFTDPRGMRRPIDDFFESLARDRDNNAACVILSGTGADGSRGLRLIKERGGICVVQEPETAAYDGMPAAAIGTGLVDIKCPPSEILKYLADFFERGHLAEAAETDDGRIADHVIELCEILRDRVGHDFSGYKRSTLNRRVARRMQVLGIDEGKEYVDHLRENESECRALLRDLLINVTQFFRDPKHFEVLQETVIDSLVAQARDGEDIRVWVPGCSSGEEAYSIAMMFADSSERQGKRPYVQIFATDIDEGMLSIARSATYSLSSLNDIPNRYQEKYVFGGTDRFSISPRIRDMVRFSEHNVVRDPPYSKISLISCRNLLIYFNEDLQKLTLPLFHFALAEDGYLFLGSSETIGRHDDLFETAEQSTRIFRKKNVKGNYTLRLPGEMARTSKLRTRNPEEVAPRNNRPNELQALKILADRYSPVSLLVDHEAMLLERWGSAGRYLEFPDRIERNVHVPTLARPGLREVISPLIRKVKETGRRAAAKNIQIRTEFGTIEARIVCEEVQSSGFLLVIQETGALQLSEVDDFDEFDLEDGQRQFLEEELQATRHRLRSTVEELETTNEELKSSNEEMMSMNEELQSTNEELTTVNDELKNKVDQLTVANSDLKNFFDSTQLAVLVVDPDLRLRSYTDEALDLFPIDKSYIGQQLGELPHRLASTEFVNLAREAASSGTQSEISLHSKELDAELILRTIPYRLLDGEVEGATLVFTDVTQALSLERDLREERERLRLALEVAKIGIWEYEPKTDRTVLDGTERQLLNLSDDDPGDSMEPILDLLSEDDRNRINRALRIAIDGGEIFDETFRLPLPDGEFRWLHGLGKPIEIAGERKFIGVTFDITPERAILAQRDLMIREMNHRVKNLFSVISAMVSISSRGADDVKEFATALRDRIHALGRSHALTTPRAEGRRGEVELKDLVETVLEPSRGGQKISMPSSIVEVGDEQVTSLALIFHEWATNSAKYGALSSEDGSIDIDWTVDDGEISIQWIEKGPASEGDDVAGFGTRLIETAARQLHGKATGEATDEGYRRTLVYPTSSQ